MRQALQNFFINTKKLKRIKKASLDTYRVLIGVEVAAEEEVPPVEAPAGPQNGLHAGVVQRAGVLPQWQQAEAQQQGDHRGQKAKGSLGHKVQQIGAAVVAGNVRQSGVRHEKATETSEWMGKGRKGNE